MPTPCLRRTLRCFRCLHCLGLAPALCLRHAPRRLDRLRRRLGPGLPRLLQATIVEAVEQHRADRRSRLTRLGLASTALAGTARLAPVVRGRSEG